MKQKRKEKTVEDSIQDFRNIYDKVQNVRKKIKEKSIQKLDLTELDVDNPLHVAEIQRRYEISAKRLAKKKREARERKENLLMLKKLKEFDYFDSWDLEDVKKKKTIAQWLREKLKGGVK
tara:strand:- start:481 stop:840 length:360 start_codon:yes stop_codon:yes gene_type:complete